MTNDAVTDGIKRAMEMEVVWKKHPFFFLGGGELGINNHAWSFGIGYVTSIYTLV